MSGKAPPSITSGVNVVSNLLRKPAKMARGKAKASATSIPPVKFRKLCATRVRNCASRRDEARVATVAVNAGSFDPGTIPKRTVASQIRKMPASETNHRYFSAATA
jgi:hypothetical protein